MAKKNFKDEMGNMLQESLNIVSNDDKKADNDVPTLADYEQLKARIEMQSRELRLWRQGLLTQALFEQSLDENGLKYNIDLNQIEAKE